MLLVEGPKSLRTQLYKKSGDGRTAWLALKKHSHKGCEKAPKMAEIAEMAEVGKNTAARAVKTPRQRQKCEIEPQAVKKEGVCKGTVEKHEVSGCEVA